MRVAVIGDCDTYFIRGLERPRELLPHHGLAILNTLRGFRELGVRELHLVVVTPEVREPQVEPGPYGIVHRVPCP